MIKEIGAEKARGHITREEILNEAIRIFKQAQYEVYLETVRSAAFDFIARKKLSMGESERITFPSMGQYALIKTILDLDGFRKNHGKELLWLSRFLRANPLIVSEYSSQQKMIDDVLYMRHNVPAVNLNTLEKIIHQQQKLQARARPGNLVVNLNISEFKRLMKERNVKKTELAEFLQVSRRMIDRYEKGECFPTPEKARKLIQFFQTDIIIKSANPLEDNLISVDSELLSLSEFQPRSNLQKEASQYLDEIGYLTSWFKSIPFDGLCWDSEENEPFKVEKIPQASEKTTDVVFMGVSEDLRSQSVHKKVRVVLKMSQFAERNALWILDEDDLTPSELELLQQKYGDQELIIISLADLEGISRRRLQELLKRRTFNAS